MEGILLGTLTAGTATTAAVSTAGLFGVGGSFSIASTLMTVGSAVSAIGSITAGNSQNQLAQYNAQIAENEAVYAQQKSEVERKSHLRRTRNLIGRQQVQGVKMGGLTSEGSLLEVAVDDVRQAKHDELLITHAGTVQAVGKRAEAAASRYQGKIAKRQGYMNAFGTVASGASRSLLRKV